MVGSGLQSQYQLLSIGRIIALGGGLAGHVVRHSVRGRAERVVTVAWKWIRIDATAHHGEQDGQDEEKESEPGRLHHGK